MADLTVKCTCGNELDAEFTTPPASVYHRVDLFLEVEPCSDCVAKAKEEGIEQGKEEVING